VLLKLPRVPADTQRVFGFGSRSDSSQRPPLVDWRTLAPYGLTLLATLAVGWAIAQLG
jgi:hypothetical protein